jgi:hypothetical protein
MLTGMGFYTAKPYVPLLGGVGVGNTVSSNMNACYPSLAPPRRRIGRLRRQKNRKKNPYPKAPLMEERLGGGEKRA